MDGCSSSTTLRFVQAGSDVSALPRPMPVRSSTSRRSRTENGRAAGAHHVAPRARQRRAGDSPARRRPAAPRLRRHVGHLDATTVLSRLDLERDPRPSDPLDRRRGSLQPASPERQYDVRHRVSAACSATRTCRTSSLSWAWTSSPTRTRSSAGAPKVDRFPLAAVLRRPGVTVRSPPGKYVKLRGHDPLSARFSRAARRPARAAVSPAGRHLGCGSRPPRSSRPAPAHEAPPRGPTGSASSSVTPEGPVFRRRCAPGRRPGQGVGLGVRTAPYRAISPAQARLNARAHAATLALVRKTGAGYVKIQHDRSSVARRECRRGLLDRPRAGPHRPRAPSAAWRAEKRVRTARAQRVNIRGRGESLTVRRSLLAPVMLRAERW